MFIRKKKVRLGDVYASRWKDIVLDGEQYRMSTVIQKTTTPIYLPLSRHAVRWLPERNGTEDGLHVFAGLPAEPNINKVPAKWMTTAEINKKINYHTRRHTYADVLTLSQGVPIDTVSELLGHRDRRFMHKYGLCPLMGRISINTEVARFSAKKDVAPSLWDAKAYRMKGKSRHAVEVNRYIENMTADISRGRSGIRKRTVSCQ